jgi:uncharacterized protein
MLRDRVVDGEQRWHTIGLIEGVLLLLVVHTMRGEDEEEMVRIVSAREATTHERRLYEDGQD